MILVRDDEDAVQLICETNKRDRAMRSLRVSAEMCAVVAVISAVVMPSSFAQQREPPSFPQQPVGKHWHEVPSVEWVMNSKPRKVAPGGMFTITPQVDRSMRFPKSGAVSAIVRLGCRLLGPTNSTRKEYAVYFVLKTPDGSGFDTFDVFILPAGWSGEFVDARADFSKVLSVRPARGMPPLSMPDKFDIYVYVGEKDAKAGTCLSNILCFEVGR